MSNMLRQIRRKRKKGSTSVVKVEKKTALYTKQAMMYQCQSCGKKWQMWLQTGLEEHGQNHKPVPYMIRCKHCSGRAHHIDWHEDVYLETPIEITEDMDYFANYPKWDCGKPVYRKR